MTTMRNGKMVNMCTGRMYYEKAIIYVLLISALLSCMVTGGSAVQVSATAAGSSNKKDLSHRLEVSEGGIAGYFSEKYEQSTGWTMTSSKSTKDVSGFIPIEVQGGAAELFPYSIVRNID